MPRFSRRSFYVQPFLVLAFFLLLMILPSSQSAFWSGLRSNASTASTFTVNSTTDGPDTDLSDGVCNDGTGVCTLRAAIMQANFGVSSADVINFNLPANSTINLDTALDSVGDDLNINGPGAQTLRVQRSTAGGTPLFTIFTIFPNKNVSISGLTISRGDFSAIFNQGSLVISNCIVDGNRHGVINRSELVINDSVISNSTETGVQNEGQPATTPTATINSSTISGNSLGGIFNQSGFASSVATLTVNNSTISANNFGDGSGGGITTGGIQGGTATTFINNSTISGNRALLSPGFAGGVTALGWDGGSGTVTLSNCTVTANDAPGVNSGAAGMIIDTTNGGSAAITLHNTIVAGNYRLGSTPSDITGTVNPASSFNLIGTGGSGGLTNGVNNNQVGVVNPGLGPLAANGGPTTTHALLNGSPAIDAGNSALGLDQRGQPRPIDDPNVVNAAGGNGSDIGAYEAHTFEVNSTADTDDGLCRASGTGNGCTLREAINAASSEGGAKLIAFASALTSGGPATITLTSALPNLTSEISITGPGSSLLTVQRSTAGGTPSFRIFDTFNTVLISGLTLTNGRTEDGAAGTNGAGSDNGGGIRNFGNLTLTDVSIIGNRTGDGGNGVGNGGSAGRGGGVANSGTLTMTNCTVSGNNGGRGGDATSSPGNGGSGGGIFNEGTMTMTGCVVDGNTGGRGGDGGSGGGARGGDGGGIQDTEGILTLTNVTISNNDAGDSGNSNSFGGFGGGISTAGNNAVVTLVNSAVTGNQSGSSVSGTPGFGGGIMNQVVMFITGSTISGNTSGGPGGGIMVRKLLRLSNSTVSGNQAQQGGGGIYNDGGTTVTLTNATFTGNSAPGNQGNGILSFSAANVRNSIIAGNGAAGAPDLNGPFNSQGHNLIGNADSATGFTAMGDQAGTAAAPINPGLGPLANNGGPTATHALLSGSLAIDAGDNCVLNNSCSPALDSALTTDQRGSNRAIDGNGDSVSTVDIGAYEANTIQVNSTADASDGVCAPVGTGNGCTLRERRPLPTPTPAR
jgi:CSLREA domain-containing protein